MSPILLIAVGASLAPVLCSAQSQNTIRSEVDRRLDAVWKTMLSRCGDTVVLQYEHYGNEAYLALKNAKQVIEFIKLTDADRLNGIQANVFATVKANVARNYNQGWSDWRMTNITLYSTSLTKRNGKWEIEENWYYSNIPKTSLRQPPACSSVPK